MSRHPSQIEPEHLAAQVLADNPAMCGKIAAGAGLNQADAAPMLAEVIRFMSLVAWSNQVLTPPRQLDDAWHEFILFTRTYDAFCHEHFGRFIHHQPGGEHDENRRQLRRTLKLYTLCFKRTPPEAFWGGHGYYTEAAECGGCESDSEKP